MSKLGRKISSTSYSAGWRPTIPTKLDFACPDLATLITEMWVGDFRARPSLKDVVARLEATASADLSAGDGVQNLTDDQQLNGLKDDDISSTNSSSLSTSLTTSKDAKIEAQQETISTLQDRIEILMRAMKSRKLKLRESSWRL